MTSPSGTKGRSASYEKMLVADTFLIIGCILLSFGLGLSFYSVPAMAQDSITTLSIDNSYSQNYSISLELGDRLLLGAKPYALANLSLLLSMVDSEPVIYLRASEAGALLNFTYVADVGGEYTIRVYENITDPSNKVVTCELEVMLVMFPVNPVRPYLLYGIALVAAGLVSLIYSKRAGVKTKDPGEWYELSAYFLPAVFVASTIGFALLFSLYVFTGSSLMGLLGDGLLVAFSALNVSSLLVGVILLQGKPLIVFLRTLFMSITIWFVTLTLLVILLPTISVQYMMYWDPGLFVRSMQGLASLNSTFYQIVTIAVILVLAYCLSFRFGKHRIYSYQVDTEVVEAGTLSGLLRQLKVAIGGKNLEGFFERLRERDLESSAFLFFLLSEHISTGTNSFTYHSIIAQRRDVFSKDIYERDPAQKTLQPLGILRVSGKGRFRRYRLLVGKPFVNRLVTLFRGTLEKQGSQALAAWSGTEMLKLRRMRYAGELTLRTKPAEKDA